jgi:hypothetical protein
VSPLRRRLAAALYVFFVGELGCLALVFFQVDELLLPHEWRAPFRLACGGALLLGALVFVPARVGARGLLLERLAVAPRGGRRGRWRRLFHELVIQLVAIALLGGAVYELARALPHYV